MSDIPALLTFRQFSEKHQAFTEASLRWLRFRSEESRCIRSRRKPVADEVPNGFADAFVQVGRRVLIDEVRFFRIIAVLNGGKGS